MISLTSPVETRAHGWPAGVKLIALAGATIALFQTTNLVWLSAVFGLTLVVYAVPGGVFWASGVRRILPLWPFVALIMVWHVVLGTAQEGLVICLRMLTAVALANLVTMTTRLADMMKVTDTLLRPLRRCGVNTRAVPLAIGLMIRFTPVLAQKGAALRQSWRARAHRRPGWRLLLPFAVAAIDDAEHVADALRARGGM
ncbi:MAG: energy-coupling factor transporter transmembrane protein EcfT [Pseudomonadota bacterium]